MADSQFTPGDVREDLKKLRESMKRLAVGYEMFLNQTVKWPPHERKAECEAIVRYYTKYPPRHTASRFLFNNLVHRYRTNMERWRRRLRALEESGEFRPGQNGARNSNRANLEDPTRPYTLMSVTVDDSGAGSEQVRDLYLAYRQARRARGLAVSKMGYGKFAESINKHMDQARQRAKQQNLELRIDTLDGKVRIAVRPVSKATSASGTSGSRTGSS